VHPFNWIADLDSLPTYNKERMMSNEKGISSLESMLALAAIVIFAVVLCLVLLAPGIVQQGTKTAVGDDKSTVDELKDNPSIGEITKAAKAALKDAERVVAVYDLCIAQEDNMSPAQCLEFAVRTAPKAE